MDAGIPPTSEILLSRVCCHWAISACRQWPRCYVKRWIVVEDSKVLSSEESSSVHDLYTVLKLVSVRTRALLSYCDNADRGENVSRLPLWQYLPHFSLLRGRRHHFFQFIHRIGQETLTCLLTNMLRRELLHKLCNACKACRFCKTLNQETCPSHAGHESLDFLCSMT